MGGRPCQQKPSLRAAAHNLRRATAALIPARPTGMLKSQPSCCKACRAS
jgi:hypothetical protein